MIKVHGGTMSDEGQMLCCSCRNGTVAEGPKGVLVKCSEMGERIRFRVTKCGAYDDRAKTSIGDLYRTAWILSTDKKRQIGFAPYKKWKEENPRDLEAYY